ncbi:MAG: hypothetical protein M1275_03435 [Patescibacteria group bacterium]|nr:hypothetical protein [Patescibacteria group bacterium]
MKQNFFLKSISSLLVPAVLFLTVPAIFLPSHEANAFVFSLPKGQFSPFGGNIVTKELNVCLRSIPFPPYVLTIPFYVFLVYQPSPAGLYWLFGISQLYEEYEFEETANSLGNYLIGADKAWRAFCDINGATLPTTVSGTTWTGVFFEMPITGVAWKMGTSCRVPPQYVTDECHQKVAKRTLKQIAP